MHKRTSNRRHIGVARLLTAAALAGLLQLPHADSAAAVSGSTPMRIGLLLNSNPINTATDTVTLQGRAGLGVGFYKNGQFAELFAATTAVKASLDNYYLSLGEFDLPAAQALRDRVDRLGLSVDLLVSERGGVKRYQVVSGYPETWAKAEALQKRLSGLGTPVIRGYMRLTTGLLGGRDQALAKSDALRDAGFAAYPIVRKSGQWEVWIGDEASQAQLDALKADLQDKVPGTYSAADYKSADYLLMKTGLHGTAEVPHLIQCSTQTEAAFLPKGSPAVTKVVEKAREYRGAILVQGYNQKPSVINYVPMDQYLYGLVPQEMSSGWPLEALKAQAVAARTYAARKIGRNKWGVADLVDDVWDQAYYGFNREAADTNRAVDETRGQVLMKNGTLVEALYSSNQGGYSGDVREIWKSTGYEYLKATPSPWDEAAAANEPLYYRVQLPSGEIGWIKAAGVKKAGTNRAGLPTGTTSGGQPLRAIPEASAKVMSTPPAGQRVVILAEEKEYNPYNWQRGPYTPSEMMTMINGALGGFTSPVYDLRVSKYGQGDRALEIRADGRVLGVSNPDGYRWVFDDMWSTRIRIDQLGTYTVLGADGRKSEYPHARKQGQTLNVISGSGAVTAAVNGTSDKFVVQGAGGQTRVAAKDQSYVISGNGYGHGLGMSQWGANGMAKAGYTYDKILTHYYQGVLLTEKQ